MNVDTKIVQTQKEVASVAPLFDAYRVFYGQESDVQKAKDFLLAHLNNKSSIIIMAQIDNIIVGFTQLYPSYSSVSMQALFILNDLYVDENYRGKGIGEQLIYKAQYMAEEHKWKGLILETAKDNPAQHLYEKLGWIKDEEYLHYGWTV